MGDIKSSAEIGRLIRAYRQDAGLSQEKLAEMVGVSFQQIQKYENGKTTLNIAKLQYIAKALKLTVADLLDVQPDKRMVLSCQEEQLLRAFRQVKNLGMKHCILKLVSNINKRVK